jgi:phenylalanyl-tRNA synthetase beta chain
MPVVRVRPETLMRLTGINSIEALRHTLFNLKCESEVGEDGQLAIEVQSDRIDMFSVEGIAKAVRLYLGIDKPINIKLKGAPFKVYVKPPAKRPFIAVAAVTNVGLDEEKLRLLIEFQERLHNTFGRNRRKVAIGLHDLDKLPSAELEYKDVNIDETTMIPLHDFRRMSIRQVLESTEQGSLYGSIALNGNLHPAILSGGEVISLPPVINSDITRLSERTRNILIDVTGTDANAISIVLNSIIHALTFYGGEVLGAVIIYPDKAVLTPDLSSRIMRVDLSFVRYWLGIEGESSRIVDALMRMGYNVKTITHDYIDVEIPYYRGDILHQVDIVEDIAIGLGYENIGIEEIEPKPLIRKKLTKQAVISIVRDVLVGLGYVELNTLTLVPRKLAEDLGFNDVVSIVNAPSVEINALRSMLLQSIIQVLRNSQYIPQPVKVFEVGEVVVPCHECYNRWRNEVKVCWAIMDSETRFEEVHATLYALMSELGLAENLSLRPCNMSLFTEGRCANIFVADANIGFMGEVQPEKLEKIGILYPITLAELSIDSIFSVLANKIKPSLQT